ncbi:hypothetical protein BASA61_002945 [Batrachochytrium salamandrivorans]|nr:hypothetical protein BASA61_002945 [Batrachochytrium salamandrivorans]
MLIQRQGYMPRSDKRSIQKAVKKVTEAFEGENGEEFVTEVEAVLTYVLSSARRSLAAYNSQTSTPFFLFIPRGANQQSLTEKILDLHKDGKVLVKETLEDITHLVSRIITNPQKMMKELKKIMRSITNMFRLTQVSYNSDYKMLLSEVNNPKNEACVKVTKAYIHQMESGRDLALLSLKRIKSMIDSGSMRPKETNPSEFSSSTLNVRDRQEVSSESSAEMLTESP